VSAAGWTQRTCTTLLRADPAVTLSPFIAIIHDEKPINSPTGDGKSSPTGGYPPHSAAPGGGEGKKARIRRGRGTGDKEGRDGELEKHY